jgi:hypothetical protein
MNDVRDNAIVGVISFEDSLVPVTLHFSEWWNGEGLDANFVNEAGKTISLHMDEIEALVVAAKIVGLIDFKSIKKRVKQVRKEADKYKEGLK